MSSHEISMRPKGQKFRKKKKFYKKDKNKKIKKNYNKSGIKKPDSNNNLKNEPSVKNNFDLKKKKNVYNARILKRLGYSKKFEDLNVFEKKIVLMSPRIYRKIQRERNSDDENKMRKCKPRHKEIEKSQTCIRLKG
ncbi:hypothetical protein DMUE_5034 [Dictyocoela muelleri]|nr:hypothetical protein DMUE_5034 [Dictyocoela muelleri]